MLEYHTLRIQSPCQMMIGVCNHLLSKVSRFHYHSQKVIGSLRISIAIKRIGCISVFPCGCRVGESFLQNMELSKIRYSSRKSSASVLLGLVTYHIWTPQIHWKIFWKSIKKKPANHCFGGGGEWHAISILSVATAGWANVGQILSIATSCCAQITVKKTESRSQVPRW